MITLYRIDSSSPILAAKKRQRLCRRIYHYDFGILVSSNIVILVLTLFFQLLCMIPQFQLRSTQYVTPLSFGPLLYATRHGPRPDFFAHSIQITNKGTLFFHGYITISSATGLGPSGTCTSSSGDIENRFKTDAATCRSNPYFNILAPQVAGNISTDEYDSLFQTFKVIYPDYASRHFVEDLKTLVTDTMTQRWSIYLQPTDFYLMLDTGQGTRILDDLPHSILDILNWYYPTWKIHQHLDAFASRPSSSLPLVPHPDQSDTGLLVRIQSIPRGHPFFSPTRTTTS